MEKTVNLYQTLNKREKYILKNLDIIEDDLKPENRDDVIGIMLRMTKRISQLPITEEQFQNLLNNVGKSQEIFFKDIQFIMTEADYPNTKFNVYKTLEKEDFEVLKILDIKLEDREITSKEYAKLQQKLYDNLLIKFGTGIKEEECYKLTDKVARKLS